MDFSLLNNYEAIIEGLSETTPYFPDYYSEIREGKILFACNVRHEHGGKWYKNLHVIRGYTHIGDNIFRAFLKQVYLDIKLGKIDPSIKRPNGKPLYPVDSIQISEEERLL